MISESIPHAISPWALCQSDTARYTRQHVCLGVLFSPSLQAKICGASPGEIYLDAAHAKGERDLAAVAQVVFEDMPDHPGA